MHGLTFAIIIQIRAKLIVPFGCIQLHLGLAGLLGDAFLGLVVLRRKLLPLSSYSDADHLIAWWVAVMQ